MLLACLCKSINSMMMHYISLSIYIYLSCVMLCYRVYKLFRIFFTTQFKIYYVRLIRTLIRLYFFSPNFKIMRINKSII